MSENLHTPYVGDLPAASAVSWPSIFAGALVAMATSAGLLTLGTGLGLATKGHSPTAFTIGAGLWLIVMQWLSSALGGYITGRLRTRWVGVHTHEVFFRDSAHGLLAWALATVVVAWMTASGTVAGDDTARVVDAVAEAGDHAQRSAGSVAIFTAISMLIGAFIACVAADGGGRLRDEHP